MQFRANFFELYDNGHVIEEAIDLSSLQSLNVNLEIILEKNTSMIG
jgi:hypothetical protein